MYRYYPVRYARFYLSDLAVTRSNCAKSKAITLFCFRQYGGDLEEGPWTVRESWPLKEYMTHIHPVMCLQIQPASETCLGSSPMPSFTIPLLFLAKDNIVKLLCKQYIPSMVYCCTLFINYPWFSCPPFSLASLSDDEFKTIWGRSYLFYLD